MAAEHHSVAAVLNPRTLNPSLKDEARAQEPDAGNDLDRDGVGLTSPGHSAANITKVAAPRETSALVLSPAKRWRHWRSKPMAAPSNSPTTRLNAECLMPLNVTRLPHAGFSRLKVPEGSS